MENYTIGADPELFIIDETTNSVVSSIGLIPGKKGEPYVAEDMPKGFGLETDNILAEFNIPPCTTKEAFINNIEYMKSYIRSFVKKVNPNLGILCEASQMVPADQLKSKEAKEFGCSVDFNAYTESANPKPKGTSTNLRSAGLHIHVGYENPNVDESLRYIKRMDVTLGAPSIIFDQDSKRRSLYGKAGAFRLTPYGFEYRVLSSKMMSTPELLGFVWSGIEMALDDEVNLGNLGYTSHDIQTIINGSELKYARDIYKKLY